MSTREALARVFAGPKDDLGLGCSESVGKPSSPNGVRYYPCGRAAHAYVAAGYDLDRLSALCKLHTTLAVKRGGRLDRLVTEHDRRAAEQRRWDTGYAIALSRVDNTLEAIHEAGYEVLARDVAIDADRLATAMHNTDATGCSSLVVPGSPFPRDHRDIEDVPYAAKVAAEYERLRAAAAPAEAREKGPTDVRD